MRSRALLQALPGTPEWEVAKRRLEHTLQAIDSHPEQQNSKFPEASTRV
jgi:hypothetical protein